MKWPVKWPIFKYYKTNKNSRIFVGFVIFENGPFYRPVKKEGTFFCPPFKICTLYNFRQKLINSTILTWTYVKNNNPLNLNSLTQKLTFMESAQKLRLDIHWLWTLWNQKIKANIINSNFFKQKYQSLLFGTHKCFIALKKGF